MKKKYFFVVLFLVLALVITMFLVGCSGKKTEDKKEASVVTPIVTETPIVCDKFVLVTKVTGSTLDLSIDTDLPDNTVVMVSVSRSYWEPDNVGEYSIDYFSEKSTIEKWKSEHSISIASEVWNTALRALQDKMSGFGLGFDVASISDKIEVRMVVPGTPIIDEIEIDYPLIDSPVGKSPFPSLDPLELEIGQVYVVSEQTPLMPSHTPDDPIAALQQMKQIPKEGGFKILEVYNATNNPWYKVNAFDNSTEEIGIGWINSIALFGQQLKVYK